jgi:Tfp pilus assembly protein PilV
MRFARDRLRLPSEGGFALIEVVISAFLIVLVGSAVLGLVTSSTRSAYQQRARTQAYSLAQEDQSRLRTLRISTLDGLSENRTVTLNGTVFNVESSGVFVNSTSGSASCSENESSPDYVRITSTVTQKSGKGSPISLRSIIAPSNGSLDPTHGDIVISATNGQGQPLQGLVLTGNGASNFSGETDENGCAIFADLPAGTYTLTPSGVGLVDKTGKAPTSQPVQLGGNQTQRIPLMYDKPGSLRSPFYYKIGTTSTSIVPSKVMLYNAESGSTATSYTPTTETVGTTKYAAMSNIFPFKTAYSIYAGSCEGDQPGSTGTEGIGTAIVPSAGSVTSGQIRMPTLELTVANGTTKLQGAKVVLTDEDCPSTKYTYTTEANGHQSETSTGPMTPAVPWSKYKICASASISGTTRKTEVSGVVVETFTSTVTKALSITSTTTPKESC